MPERQEAVPRSLYGSITPNVDAVGACVGMNGARVNAIVEELRGEKIDIVNWDENPGNLIQNALSPAKIVAVFADPDEKTAKVVVPIISCLWRSVRKVRTQDWQQG